MKPVTTKLSSRGQVVLPKEMREELDLKEGDLLVIEVDQEGLHLTPIPRRFSEWTRGLGKEVWRRAGGTEAYLRRERDAWDETT